VSVSSRKTPFYTKFAIRGHSTIGRKITFIYAIRDDMFKDTDRTKFFDYITTVIPVINYSNSKEKLTKALRAKGYRVEKDGDFEIEDIEDIAFFMMT
jgi:hypothetical protein